MNNKDKKTNMDDKIIDLLARFRRELVPSISKKLIKTIKEENYETLKENARLSTLFNVRYFILPTIQAVYYSFNSENFDYKEYNFWVRFHNSIPFKSSESKYLAKNCVKTRISRINKRRKNGR